MTRIRFPRTFRDWLVVWVLILATWLSLALLLGLGLALADPSGAGVTGETVGRLMAQGFRLWLIVGALGVLVWIALRAWRAVRAA